MVVSNTIEYPYFPFRVHVDIVLVSRVDDLSRQFHRTAFEKALSEEGLHVFHEVVGPILFTLISCPFHRLCREAEKRDIYFPLKHYKITPSRPRFCPSLYSLFVASDTVRHISAPFEQDIAESFVNYNREDEFFSSMLRSLITYQILSEVDISRFISDASPRRGSSVSTDEVLRRKGLLFLEMEKAYDDIFILHDPSEEEPYYKKMRGKQVIDISHFMGEKKEDPRARLSARWTRFLRTQPLNLVRRYFGEQIGFYFAWQGTFCTCLAPALFAGIAVFVYGMATTALQVPLSGCPMNELNETIECNRTVSQVFSAVSKWFTKSFDSEATPFYALFMSIWGDLYVERFKFVLLGTIFCQIWKRNSEVYKYRWDCEDVDVTEPDRPEFVGTRQVKV